MRRWGTVLLALAACDPVPPDYELRHGLTKEELNEGPSYHRMKGAILNDVRVWKGLDRRLDEGRSSCPEVVRDGGGVRCSRDKEPFEVYVLTDDLPDKPYRVDELAYFCRTEGVYYYHYRGGPRRRDVWLGPYKLDRTPPKVDD
jgi:hypothetical protein